MSQFDISFNQTLLYRQRSKPVYQVQKYSQILLQGSVSYFLHHYQLRIRYNHPFLFLLYFFCRVSFFIFLHSFLAALFFFYLFLFSLISFCLSIQHSLFRYFPILDHLYRYCHEIFPFCINPYNSKICQSAPNIIHTFCNLEWPAKFSSRYFAFSGSFIHFCKKYAKRILLSEPLRVKSFPYSYNEYFPCKYF